MRLLIICQIAHALQVNFEVFSTPVLENCLAPKPSQSSLPNGDFQDELVIIFFCFLLRRWSKAICSPPVPQYCPSEPTGTVRLKCDFLLMQMRSVHLST